MGRLWGRLVNKRNDHKNIKIYFSDGKYFDILKDKRNWPYLGLTLVRKTTNNIKGFVNKLGT